MWVEFGGVLSQLCYGARAVIDWEMECTERSYCDRILRRSWEKKRWLNRREKKSLLKPEHKLVTMERRKITLPSKMLLTRAAPTSARGAIAILGRRISNRFHNLSINIRAIQLINANHIF